MRRAAILILVPTIAVPAIALAATDDRQGFRQEATFLVPSGASEESPGNAYDANQLAITYASLIPRDAELLQRVSDLSSVPSPALRRGMQWTTVGDTSLLTLSYKGPTENEVERVIAAMIATLTSKTRVTAAIAPGSLLLTDLSQMIEEATPVATVLPLAAMLGIALGAAFAIAVERALPRVHNASQLAILTNLPVSSRYELQSELGRVVLSRWEGLAPGLEAITLVAVRPGEFSVTEDVAQIVALLSVARGRPAVVMSWRSRTEPAIEARRAARGWRAPAGGETYQTDQPSPSKEVTGSVELGSAEKLRVFAAGSTSNGEGATVMSLESGFVVLAVAAGSKVTDVVATIDMLRRLGVPPRWAVFVERGRASHRHDGAAGSDSGRIPPRAVQDDFRTSRPRGA